MITSNYLWVTSSFFWANKSKSNLVTSAHIGTALSPTCDFESELQNIYFSFFTIILRILICKILFSSLNKFRMSLKLKHILISNKLVIMILNSMSNQWSKLNYSTCFIIWNYKTLKKIVTISKIFFNLFAVNKRLKQKK